MSTDYKQSPWPHAMNRFQRAVAEWAHTINPNADEHTIIAHLKREIAELDIETAHAAEGNGLSSIGEEAADCLLLLLALGEHRGFSLIDEAVKKFECNKRRTWGTPDSEGVVEHIPVIEVPR